MVIPDADQTQSRLPTPVPAPAAHRPRLAPPLHRLAAVVLDVGVVLTPVYAVLAAPFKRVLTERAIVGAEGTDFLVIGIAAIALLIGFVYQVGAHCLFGATVGKRAFGLRVTGVRGRPGACLARSGAWFASLGLGGLPFLAVFAHARRQTAHDRVAETLVTIARGGVGAPDEWSRVLIRVTYASATIVASIVTVLALRDAGLAGHAQLQAALTGEVCDVVSRSVGEDAVDDHARLRVGLTLYAAGLADRSCLAREVDREVAVQTPPDATTYLAQAFVNAEDAEVSNAYLDRTCAEGTATAECAMSRLVTRWSAGDADGVGRVLASAPAGAAYLDVWAVRHRMKQAEYDGALDALDRLLDRPEIAEFTLDKRVRALYGLGRFAEARAAYKQAVPALETEPALELSAFACVAEFARGCAAARETACTRLDPLDASADASPLVRLAQVRAAECAPAAAPVEYGDLADAALDDAWRDLYLGSARVHAADRAGAARAFRAVLADDEAGDEVRVEALRRLAMIASREELRDLADEWADWESPEAYAAGGNLLVERLLSRHDVELATRVAADLAERRALSPHSSERLAQAGARDEANERRPASAGHR